MTWNPSDKQLEFLQATEFEVLYGGAAGGGKTDALIIDAMGLGHHYKGVHTPCIQHPAYRALILRTTFPELKEVVDRGRKYFETACPGAFWHGGDKEFRFPSGARIEMGYIARTDDQYQYQSREFQYVGWEELTEHPFGNLQDSPYGYLLSRIRGPAELPKYCRATCNPGGPGHEAVKAYWQIPDEGSATLFDVEYEDGNESFKRRRRFIPARLGDNSHIGPEYRRNLLMMSEQNKRALLEGRWDIYEVDGAILAPQMVRAFEEDRIGEFPVRGGSPVNTFWDIGRNSTAIAFHQRNGSWDDWVDYEELSGEGAEDAAKIVKGKDYVYGKHYLPHDVQNADWSATKDRKAILEGLGIRPIVVVPRVREIATGIELLRLAFNTYRFNKPKVEQLLKCLKNYKFERDELRNVYKPEPAKDWASHGTDAVRQHAQGFKPDTGWDAALQSKGPTTQRRGDSPWNRLKGDSSWRV